MKKHKFEGFLDVLREKLDRLYKDIKKLRNGDKANKDHIKRLIAEAKELKELLKDD